MKSYSGEAWRRLGSAVQSARLRAGMHDSAEWAEKVGRSTRVLLGLERGERTGASTLARVEEALGWPAGKAFEYLEDGDAGAAPTVNAEPEGAQTVNVSGRLQDREGTQATITALSRDLVRARHELEFTTREAGRLDEMAQAARERVGSIEVQLAIARAMLRVLTAAGHSTPTEQDVVTAHELAGHDLFGKRLTKRAEHALAADHQDETPEGIRLREEQDKAGEEGGA